MSVDETLDTREHFKQVSDLISKYSFISESDYWPLIINLWKPEQSGTCVFIQKIEHEDDNGKKWRELVEDKKTADIHLVNRFVRLPRLFVACSFMTGTHSFC